MSDPVKDLLTLLDLEQLEVNLFRGQSPENETNQRVFGGQVIAQALNAAYRTVEDRVCHSLHAYFIRPGDPDIPIIYEVDRARDGGSFTTRRVIAIQHGRQIFNMACSFHVEEEGWHHQHEMPEVQGHETLMPMEELRAKIADKIPEPYRDQFLRPRAVEIREIDPMHMLKPKPMPDVSHLWFRVAGEIDESLAVHQCLLAYASDMRLLGTAQRRHGVSWLTGEVMSASLDHSMWFHEPVKFDDWLLYSMDAPWAGSARSFNRGKIFTEDGRLVASVAQEGLMRPNRKRRKDA